MHLIPVLSQIFRFTFKFTYLFTYFQISIATIAYFIKSTLCVTCESIRFLGASFFETRNLSRKKPDALASYPWVDREEFKFLD